MFRVVQQMEGLDAAARAEVEGLGDMPAGGDLDQGGGGLPDPQDVIVAQHPRALVGREVAGHPEVRPALGGPVFPDRRIPAVWPEVHFRLDQVLAGRLHQTEFHQPGRADAGEGGVEGPGALRLGQEPETHDGGERSRRRLTGGAARDDQRGDELVPAERCMRGLAQQLRDAVHGVAHGAQVRGQGYEEGRKITPWRLRRAAGRERR